MEQVSYQSATVVTEGWCEVCGFLKIVRKAFTQFTAVYFHKVIFHLFLTYYPITAKKQQQ